MYIGRKPKDEIIQDFAEHVSWGKVQVFRNAGLDFVPGKREGCFIWDLDGETRLLDCRSSGGVFNLGHCPAATTEALKRALDELDNGDHLLLSEHRAALAARLADLLPDPLTYTILSAGGGEAIDLALKLARGVTKRPRVISAGGGYHGVTGFALSAGDPRWKEKFGPLVPGFEQVPFGDMAALERAVDEETAAVILETIPATAGVQIPPPDFFPALRRLCDERGALWIDDEVQTGLGRTGRLWAVEEHGVSPDIMVLGKGLGGAVYPMAATCIGGKLEQFFRDDPFLHVSTGGGTDLGCVVTIAMLDEITRPGLLEHVNEMGTLFAEGLADLGRRFPEVQVAVRQRGLMIGVETAGEMMGMMMSVQLARNGVLAFFAENHKSTVIIMPPLVIEPDEVRFVLEALEASYGEIRG